MKFDRDWFGFRAGDTMLHVGNRSIILCIAQAFNRRFVNDEHCWGIGVIQIGRRHLFYVGHSGISLLFFIGRI